MYKIISKTPRCIGALILREMSTTYGRHPGGYIWAFLEPIAALTLLTVVFSLVFRSPAIGDNFPLFYATGYLPFMMYMDISNKVAQSIKYSRQLLFYPRITFLDAILARFSLNFLVQFVVFIVIISGIRIHYDTGNLISYHLVALSLILSACLGLGVGTVNCYLSVRYPFWDRVWAILNRPAFIVSGVFFIYESVSQPFRSYLWFNPLIHVVGLMRAGFYPTYDANYTSTLFVISVSGICFVLGLILLVKRNRDLLYL